MRFIGQKIIFILSLLLFTLLAHAEQVPFTDTGDLFVIDSKSGILRVNSSKNISVFLSIDQIESVIGVGESSLGDNGIVFDRVGNIYFSDGKHILKHTKSTNTLSILATESSIKTVQGVESTDVDAMAVGDNGNLFVIDDKTEAVLKINSDSGAVSVHTSQADFLSQTGIEVNLEQGIVTGKNGNIYVASQGSTSDTVENEDAIFKIDSTGTATILVSNNLMADPDQFMTTDASGNLIVASDQGETEAIFKVDIADGSVTELISTADING